MDGIRRDPSYPYNPYPITSKGNKQQDPHQKYHHYNNNYNPQCSQKQTKVRNLRSSDSSKENSRRNNIVQKNSQLPSQQKKQRHLPKDGKYLQSQKTAEKMEATTRKKDSRQHDTKNVTRRRHVRNSDQKHNTRSKDFKNGAFIPSPYHEEEGGDTKRLTQEKNNVLIKNHTKLMDQIMDDLIAEATDNEGNYYLDLAGNVRRVCT